MYAVSQEFLNQMKAPVRRVDARVTIDYTDPTQDQTIEVTASEQANASYPAQTADSATEPAYKWAALDGAWVLDGTWHLAPVPEDAYLYQMGWWSAQVAGEDGRFSEPYPTLILTHPARSVTTFQVVGDSARGEWPTEFAIRLYGPDGSLLRERSVTGNAEIRFYELLDPPALDVTRQELEIRAWSHPGRHAKILEFFTSLQETYEGSDLLELRLLEESETGSGVGIGGVTTNELAVRLVNRDGQFDVTNKSSPLRELLKPNRKIRAWLGIRADGAGQNVDRTETTQSDFASGTLDGVVATAAGDLELAVEFSDDFDRSTLGPDWEIAPGTQGSVQLQNGELVLTGGSSRRMWVRTTRTFEAHSIVFRARRDSADAGSDVGLAFNWDGNLASGAGEPLNGYRLFWAVWENPSALTIARYTNGVRTDLTSIEFPPNNNEHEFAILIEDGTIRVFVDGVQMLQASDSTYTSGYIGLTAREDSTDANRRGRYNWIVVNREPLGSRVSPVLDLSPVGTAAGSSIAWNATTPSGTSVTVETNLSLDGGVTWQGWQQVTNGGSIPGISAGTDLSNARLQTRVTLSTTDTTVTPKVHELTIQVNHEEWVPLGTFWSGDWDSQDLEAMVRARDRMELLRRTTYEPGPLKQNVSLYELAQDVLTHAKMPPETYRLDPGLQDIVVPWGWVPPGSHRDALRIIAEAGLARAYCDRDGILRIERVTAPTGGPVLEITKDDYFPPARNPVTSALVANRVVVTTQPLVPASSPEEVYRATVEVPAGQTIAVRAEYNKRPVIDAAASLESPPAGVSIVEVTYGAVAAEVQIRNTGASMASVTLAITGRPLSVQGGVQVVEEDASSVRELGLIVHEVPTNPLVQTREHAQAIAQAILARSAKQRRDVELEWRGNPALEADDLVRVDGVDAQVVTQELSWAGALSARLVARRLD